MATLNSSRIVVIGAGGIGGRLLPPLAHYLAFDTSAAWELVIVDGDRFEKRNAERQLFFSKDNKAAEMRRMLKEWYPRLRIQAVEAHLGDPSFANSSISVLPPEQVIQNGDIVLVAVDNLQTRSIISKFAQTLDTIVLIDGGNDSSTGDVLTYIRRDGVDLLRPFEQYQYDLIDPADDAPYVPACLRAIEEGQVQTLITNNFVATVMLCVLQVVLSGNLPRTKVGLDLGGFVLGARQASLKAIDLKMGDK